MTRRYFRIQPAGLGLDHLSETSSGELADGLHVFWMVHQVLRPDVPTKDYGNEIVVLEADYQWDNGDVEGVCVDGSAARLVARYSLEQFETMSADLDIDADAADFCASFGLCALRSDADGVSDSAQHSPISGAPLQDTAALSR